jgi:glycerol-3-phosphate dehydrogenase
LFSMLGGKLASYRLFAEEMTDLLTQRLGTRGPCQTQVLHLPGGDAVQSPLELRSWAHEFSVDELTVRRLVSRHGGEAREILQRTVDAPTRARVICPCESVTEVEVRHAVAHEWARSVDDVSRRTRLGLGSCGGMRCALECGAVVASERELTPADGVESAAAFLRGALRRRLPAMNPEQARQETLSRAHVYAQAGISPESESPLFPAAGQTRGVASP